MKGHRDAWMTCTGDEEVHHLGLLEGGRGVAEGPVEHTALAGPPTACRRRVPVRLLHAIPRMRFVLAAVLALACSSKASLPDAQMQDGMGDDEPGRMDTGGDTPSDACPADPSGTSFCGFPRCAFVTIPDGGSAACNVAERTPVDAGVCGGCPDGYRCAIYCPSPLGGCGPPAMCCRSSYGL
jgi:hypothetical protein